MMRVDQDYAAEGETRADSTYRWTIRGLYLVAFALNVWVLWDMVADDVQKAQMRSELERVWRKATHPFRLERQIARETGPMLWEADQIIEATAREP